MPVERVELTKIQAAWDSYLCPLKKFPVAPDKRPVLAAFLSSLTEELNNRLSLRLCALLQFLQLNNDKGADILSEHGSRWRPEMGLGIWPDREPPRQFDKKSFFHYPPGYKQPVLMYQLFRVTAEDGAREDACARMVGRGVVQLMFSQVPDEALLEAGRNVLLSRIEDPSFQQFPFYVPMLSGSTLEQATAEQLQEWSCGATVYVRESVEDNGLLIAARDPLAPVFEAMGGTDTGEGWTIPVEYEPPDQ